MALLKIQSSRYKLSQKMRAYPYCQLKYTYWRRVCQYFFIFICTHQAHNEFFSKHQNLAKNRLFDFAGHMLCHKCATNFFFEICFNIYHISSQINFGWSEHNIGRYRPAGSQKMPKKRPQKKVSYGKRCSSTKIDFSTKIILDRQKERVFLKRIETWHREPALSDRLWEMLGNFFMVQSMKIILIPNFDTTLAQDVHSYYYCFIPLRPSF